MRYAFVTLIAFAMVIFGINDAESKNLFRQSIYRAKRYFKSGKSMPWRNNSERIDQFNEELEEENRLIEEMKEEADKLEEELKELEGGGG